MHIEDDVEKAWEGVTNSISVEEWMGAFRAGWSGIKKYSKQCADELEVVGFHKKLYFGLVVRNLVCNFLIKSISYLFLPCSWVFIQLPYSLIEHRIRTEKMKYSLGFFRTRY